MKNRLEQLLTMLEDAPNEPFMLFAIAQEYQKTGDTLNALRYYETLSAEVPEYAGTYYHLGKLYEQTGRKADAIAIYKKGMAVTRSKGDAHSFSELQSALSMVSDEG